MLYLYTISIDSIIVLCYNIITVKERDNPKQILSDTVI